MRGARAGVLALAALLGACGGSDEPEELVAVPYPEVSEELAADGLGDEPDADAAAEAGQDGGAADRIAEGAPQGAVDAAGPPIAAARAFVDEREEGARTSDHLLADLTDDGSAEVIVATVDGGHEALIEVARWQGEGFETTARLPAGKADGLGRLRLADLGERAPRVLVLALRFEGDTRVAVWAPLDDGGLRSPDECPLASSVAVRSPLGRQLTLTCEAPEASSGVLEWERGAFRPAGGEDHVDPSGGDVDDVLDGDRPNSGA